MATTVDELADMLIDAFPARDVEAVLAVVDDEVEFDFGPKTLRGRRAVREFVERQLFGVGYWAEHGRRFRRGDELVAESRQELRGVEDGERCRGRAAGRAVRHAGRALDPVRGVCRHRDGVRREFGDRKRRVVERLRRAA